jgi:beta-galactosidase
MDIFRLPKFAYYFYQSQRDAAEIRPVLFIANYWNNQATKSVKIYSNCDEVELLLNGKLIAKQKPDTGIMSNNLKHAPFTFNIAYAPGTLTAKGYINGQLVTTSERKTPGKASQIKLTVDYSGKPLVAGKNDVVFVYASITDENGTVIPGATNLIKLNLKGEEEVIGAEEVKAEAGVAAFLIKAGSNPGKIQLSASADGLKNATLSMPR